LTLVEARLIEFKPRTADAPAAQPAAASCQTADPQRLQQLVTLLTAEREKAEARSAQLKTLCEQADRSRAALSEALAAATAKAEAATGSAKAITAQTEVVVMRLARVIDALPS
ncbi:MAG TPA: hypothetical protein VFF65_04030, partial [Phycisphaerales bacterium]|nr:hypothetical protein [Phycisphaerales bacterium]